jgi:hypothetical protein
MTVLALPFEAALEGDFPVVATTQKSSPADQPCPRCSGSGTECEAVSALGEHTLAALRGSDARFCDQGSRVDMRCTLCSGSGLVTAARADNIAWARNVMEENSATGRRKWSPQRRADRAWLLRLVRKADWS